MSEDNEKALDRARRLHEFLSEKAGAEESWTFIWFLQNQYGDSTHSPEALGGVLGGVLGGTLPEGYAAASVPKLDFEGVQDVLRFLIREVGDGTLQDTYPDYIDRCEVCGDLYDSESDGACLDFGDSPYHFCGECMYGDEYERKSEQGESQ